VQAREKVKALWRSAIRQRSRHRAALPERLSALLWWLAQPFRALCAPRLYAAVSTAPIRSGVGYLAYVGALWGVLASWGFASLVLRPFDETARWAAPRLPRLTFTADGVVTEVLQPYEVTRAQQVLLRVDTAAEATGTPKPSPGSTGPPIVTITRSLLTMTLPEPLKPVVVRLTPEAPDPRRDQEPYTLDGNEFMRSYRSYRALALVAAFLVPATLVFTITFALALVLSMVAWPLSRLVRSPASWRALWNMAARASTTAFVPLALGTLGVIPRTPLAASSLVLVPAAYLALGVRWAR